MLKWSPHTQLQDVGGVAKCNVIVVAVVVIVVVGW